MCGILAYLYFDRSRNVDERLLLRMTDTMRHRGPDGRGVWTDGSIGLGHRRLSIIDLTPAGHQPMSNEDGDIWIAFNGEIYNFQELRSQLEAKGHRFRTRTDTEVVLHAYEEWDIECLQRFNGMWGFALWDGRRRRLFVCRDRLGIKPLVYYAAPDRFICASEIRAIRVDRSVPLNLDAEAIHHYLSFMNVPAPFTIYQGIRKLLPGHYLLVEDGVLTIEPYWRVAPGEVFTDSREDLLDHLNWLISDSVKYRLTADVPVGTFLSGGVDSSLISAVAARHTTPDPMQTFCVGFSDLRGYDESRWARQVVDCIRSNHHELDLRSNFAHESPQIVCQFDEPFAVASGLALYSIAREAVKHVKVVLSGDGGDEVFAGYDYYHETAIKRLLRFLTPFSWLRTVNKPCFDNPGVPPRWQQHGSEASWAESLVESLRRKAMIFQMSDQALRERGFLRTQSRFTEREKECLYTDDWREQVGAVDSNQFLQQFLLPRSYDALTRWRALDLTTLLPNQMLTKVDMATMAWGLEARAPLLDHRIVEFALRLPPRMLIDETQGKLALKQIAESYVPREVLYRPKHGFNMPIGSWMRTEWRSLLADRLSHDIVRQAGVFRQDTVDALVERHCSDSSVDFSSYVYILLCFHLWWREVHAR